MIRIALVVVTAVVALEPAAQELVVSDRPTALDEVPPGTREDQLLYHSVHRGLGDLLAQTSEVNQVLTELRYSLLNLEDLAKGASPEDARRLGELRARLDAPARELSEVLPKEPLLGCRYVLQHLEDSMMADPGTPAAARLPQKREEARKCDTGMSAAVARVAPVLGKLRTALDQVRPEIQQRRAVRDAAGSGPAPAMTPAVTESGTPAAAAERR